MKKIVLSLFALLLTTCVWGQTLSGSGTESNPYQITSANDWNTFATDVNGGYSYNGKYIELTDDIMVSDMVGTWTSSTDYKPFSGTFDGGWHTITFNKGAIETPFGEDRCAPFRVIDQATIKDLIVDGTIITSKKFAGGLIGWAYSNSGTSYVNNCISRIDIISTLTNNGDATHGGFVGQQEKGTINFEECIFEGNITGSTAIKGCGFIGWRNGTVKYKNCIQAGKIAMNGNTATYHRNNGGTFDHAYYIFEPANHENYGLQGTVVASSATAPSDGIYRKYTDDGVTYYVPGGVITGLEPTSYTYIEGQPITLTPPTVEYYGRTLTRNTDYIITIDGTQVDGNLTINTAGDHIVAIEGTGSYGGSQSATMIVINFNSWAVLQAVLADDSQGNRNITLNDDIMPVESTDICLEVNGNVVLNLNGKTIDRGLTEAIVKGQVIRVNSDADLTINGPGTIKGGYNKAENDNTGGTNNDGGGIYNKGSLTLNNVTVTNNTCFKEAENSTSATGRGGGIYCASGSSFTMNGGSISNNNGRGGGGGIHCDGANVFVMIGVTVEENYCESKGAGIRVNTTGNITASLTNCIIDLNFLDADGESKGGGVYLGGGNLSMSGCKIRGNSSNRQGSGFFSMKGTTTATNCEIYYNGSNYESGNDLGAGICLYNDNSNHSVFIMDGGSIYENNSVGNGGGIYVYNGATFRVKGNVRILDNYQGTIYGSHSFNNTYLAGESVVEVIGSLDSDAYIVITPRDNGGTCVTFAEGVQTEGALSHFALDNDEYRLIPVDGHIEYYKLYLWNDPSTWNGMIATDLNGELPTASNSVTINRGVKISGDAAYANTITLGDYGEIIIADGGQLIHNGAVTATLQKNISAYTVLANQGESKTNGWYTIASPVTGDLDKECVAIGEYDLYLYNEPTHYWWNAKDGSGHVFSNISNGHGYLYANEKNVTLNFTGPMQATSANVSVPLSYTEAADNLKGYNLVGNPFTCNLTSSDAILVDEPLTTYMYVANGNEMVTATLSDRPIQPGEGFFVQASGAGQNLVFNHKASEPNRTAFIRIEAGDNSFMDRAYVQFGQGNTLHKMTINDDVPHLSIQQGRDDYASTTIKANHGTIPVSFKAATNGSYTITVSHEGMEMDYLHLIDNLTGADTDLLSEPSYTFTASNHDYASRFRLVYSSGVTTEESDNESFAFINDGQILLSGVVGDATVQLIDMNGRVVYCRDNVHTISTSGMTAGVYVLRLIQDDIVKTQKIIVD